MVREQNKKKDKIRALVFLFLFLGVNISLLMFLPAHYEGRGGVLVKRAKPQLLPLRLNSTEQVVVKPKSKLDGQEVIDESTTDPFPVAIMIDNHFDARPQFGLSRASFIYETLVEGGATRFMAVFDVKNSKIEKIGPVRSARPYFVEWAREYNALYVHAGGSPQALAKIEKDNINNLDEISWYGTRFFYRDYNLPAPHNLFTDSEHLQKALVWRNLDQADYLPWQFKSVENKIKGEQANNIYIDFSPGNTYDAYFKYLSDKNVYWRLNGEGNEWYDALDNSVLTADNVIVQFIPAEELSGGKGRLYLDIHGKGTGLIFQDGVVRKIYWQKPTIEERTKFYYKEEEEEVKLNPGLTWIVVVPGEREVRWSNSGAE